MTDGDELIAVAGAEGSLGGRGGLPRCMGVSLAQGIRGGLLLPCQRAGSEARGDVSVPVRQAPDIGVPWHLSASVHRRSLGSGDSKAANAGRPLVLGESIHKGATKGATEGEPAILGEQ